MSRCRIWSQAGSACYFFIIIVIRDETTAAAPWALLLIVRTLFNDAITVALWTGLHVCLPVEIFASLPRLQSVRFDPIGGTKERLYGREEEAMSITVVLSR